MGGVNNPRGECLNPGCDGFGLVASGALASDPGINYVNIFLPDGRLIVEISADRVRADGCRTGYPARTQAKRVGVDVIGDGEPAFDLMMMPCMLPPRSNRAEDIPK